MKRFFKCNFCSYLYILVLILCLAVGETLIYYWWQHKLVHPLQKPVCRFLKNLNLDLPLESAQLFFNDEEVWKIWSAYTMGYYSAVNFNKINYNFRKPDRIVGFQSSKSSSERQILHDFYSNNSEERMVHFGVEGVDSSDRYMVTNHESRQSYI